MGKVIGIDPGLRHTGWAVLDEQGKRVASDTLVYPARGKQFIGDYIGWVLPQIDAVVRQYDAKHAAVEIVSWYGRARKITIPLSHMAGALAGWLAGIHVETFLLVPNMKGLVRGTFASEHERDAVALARRVWAWLRAKAAGDSFALKQLSAVGERKVIVVPIVPTKRTGRSVRRV